MGIWKNVRNMHRYILAIVLFCFTLQSKAQSTYSWIKNFNKPFFKINVAEEGIYRVTFDELNALSSQDLTQIDPSDFKIYYQGKEQYMTVNTGSDQIFNSGDYIEFYGKKNNGSFDEGLYLKPSDQPHKYYSLYTDTASYFLIWESGSPGKRFTSYKDTSYSNNTPEDYYMKESVTVLSDEYSWGDPIMQLYDPILFSPSYYTGGEGWASLRIDPWGSDIFTVNTENYFSSGPSPEIEILLYGQSRWDSLGYQGGIKYHHQTNIEVGSANKSKKYRLLDDPVYEGFSRELVNEPLTSADIGDPKTYIRMRTTGVANRGLTGDYSRLYYVKITYPSDFNLNSTNQLSFNLKNNIKSAYYFKFNNYSGSHPILYDLTDGKKVYGKLSSQEFSVILLGGKPKSLFLTDSADFKTGKISTVVFHDYSKDLSQTVGYLIISNKKLKNSAQQYATYRNSTGFNTSIIYVDDLYNEFSYGIHHPLAIKNFLKYLLNDLGREPDYLLLLGKGIQNDKVRLGSVINDDLVPTIGYPPSDNYFAAGLNEPGLALPFAIGRIPAANNAEVIAYLNKLKTYETKLKVDESNPTQEWRKYFLHISGGQDKMQADQFVNYLNQYAKIAAKPKMGGIDYLISSKTTTSVDETLKDKVINRINSGINMLTYFGHGAASVLEVDIGEPQDYTQDKGNLPVFFFSGCILGNSFQESQSLGENFILTPEKGGVAWLAESWYSFTGYLHQYTRKYYEELSNKSYGEPVGKIIQHTIEDFQDTLGNRNYYNEMQILQKIFQGDPAIRLYSPSKPDFAINNQQVFITPDNASAESDSFAIGVIIKNYGMAVDDSIDLTISQTLPDFSTIDYKPLRIKSPYFVDTFYYYIKPDKDKFAGINKFNVKIDQPSEVDEIDDFNNNTASVDIFLPSSGVFPLFPRQFSIVPAQEVSLVAQSNDLFLTHGNYYFEIDTVHTFSSPWKKSSGLISGNSLVSWKTNLLPQDSTVYYWRVKIENEGQSNKWFKSSFMYINNSSTGWAQGTYHQFQTASTQDITLDTTTRKTYFGRQAGGKFNVKSSGSNSNDYDLNYNYSKLFYATGGDGLYILAINPDNQERFDYEGNSSLSKYNNLVNQNTSDGHTDKYSAVFYFDYYKKGQIDTAIVYDLIHHIDSIPKNYHVIAFSAGQHHFEDLFEDFYKAMDKLGSGRIRDVKNEYPYILIGRKGGKPGSAQETTADTASGIDPADQLTPVRTLQVYPVVPTGSVTTSVIGPSKKWKDIFIKYNALENPNQDSTSLAIFGIDRFGEKRNLGYDMVASHQDISWIDANAYPYLQLQVYMEDKSGFTPPQLDKWLVLYDYVPEGTIDPSIDYNFYKDSLQQGDSLNMSIAFKNVSEFPMDSLLVNFSITDDERKSKIDEEERYAPLNPGDTLIINKTFSTKLLKGKNKLAINVNPKLDQPELYLFNNYIERQFYVEGDETNPLVDVTFDGYRIMDGDIVSPTAEIRITAWDENQYFLLDDTSMANVYLTYPNKKEIRLTYQNDLQFIPADKKSDNKASIVYEPKTKLADGEYKLRVEATDAAGNKAGKNDYEQRFEVINKSTITHFYPYPNPFTTKMKFVFTLTGDEVPDKIHVQIMTITGKVVKNLFLEDLGPLKIGNNITDFVWDGKDQYGDPLGNGVYFYRVKTFLNGKQIEHRETAGDKFFKNNIGKIYLMR